MLGVFPQGLKPTESKDFMSELKLRPVKQASAPRQTAWRGWRRAGRARPLQSNVYGAT